jgi:hypothetical protein
MVSVNKIPFDYLDSSDAQSTTISGYGLLFNRNVLNKNLKIGNNPSVQNFGGGELEIVFKKLPDNKTQVTLHLNPNNPITASIKNVTLELKNEAGKSEKLTLKFEDTLKIPANSASNPLNGAKAFPNEYQMEFSIPNGEYSLKITNINIQNTQGKAKPVGGNYRAIAEQLAQQ